MPPFPGLGFVGFQSPRLSWSSASPLTFVKRNVVAGEPRDAAKPRRHFGCAQAEPARVTAEEARTGTEGDCHTQSWCCWRSGPGGRGRRAGSRAGPWGGGSAATSLETTQGDCCCDRFYSCRLLPQPVQFFGPGDGLRAAVGGVSCWRKSVGVA